MDVFVVNNAEMVDKVVHESLYSTTSRSRSEIQSNQSEFQLIKFNDGRKSQAEEPVEDKDAMSDVADMPSNIDNQLL